MLNTRRKCFYFEIKYEVKNKMVKEKKKKASFLKGVKSETSKIKWPESKEVMKYAVATLFICIFVGLFFQLVEFLSSILKGWL